MNSDGKRQGLIYTNDRVSVIHPFYTRPPFFELSLDHITLVPEVFLDFSSRTRSRVSPESQFYADDSCQTSQIANKKSDQWQFSKHAHISRYFFEPGVDLGKLCYEQTISTWVVKSDLLIGVNLKHVLTMDDKSPRIRTSLYKETNIVPNDCCRICRIYVKISGRSKINIFEYNNKHFSQTLSSVLFC